MTFFLLDDVPKDDFDSSREFRIPEKNFQTFEECE